tara:strand:+ start:575 stop:1390 length:816 start_codon:yes stop_codon:yes gene_type:complete
MPIPLIPIAGYGLASLGAGTALTAAGMKLAQLIPGVYEKDDIARNETVDLTNINEEGKVDRIEDYTLTDRFRDRVLGYSQEDLAETRAGQMRKGIENINKPDTKSIADYRVGLDLKPVGIQKMKPGENAEMYKRRIANQTALVNAAQQLRNNPNPNKTTLQQLGEKPNIAQINSALASAKNTDPLGARMLAQSDRAREQSRYLDLQEANLAQRRFDQMQAQNNFQLQMDQMGLNNRRYDMEAARSERRDKREMLALLLQGLGNVQSNLVNY